MYQVSEEFRRALRSEESIHRIRGRLTFVYGSFLELTDQIVDESLTIDRQCTEGKDTFGIGQLYTGTVELIAELPGINREFIRGATLTLEFGLEGLEEWVPLGEWTITEPRRESGDRLTLRGVDCIAKLDVPFDIPGTGVFELPGQMRLVEQRCGVQFAQTFEELCAMYPARLYNIWSASASPSGRAFVAQLAQIMGACAYADRYGRIAFRFFGDNETVPDIPADMRFRAQLAEYTYGLRKVTYRDSYGGVQSKDWRGAAVNTEGEIVLSGNQYIWDGQNQDYSYWLTPLAANLEQCPDWTPGEIDIYGDPTIDLGDLITVSGGINGGGSSHFLVTADYWQFRGRQTLVSAGAAETGSSYSSSGGGGSSGSSSAGGISVISDGLKTVHFITGSGELTAMPRQYAEARIICYDPVVCNVEVSALISAASQNITELRVYLDSVELPQYGAELMLAGDRRTVSFTLPAALNAGTHTLTVSVTGLGELHWITASATGRNIEPSLPYMAGTWGGAAYYSWSELAKYTWEGFYNGNDNT